MKRLLIKAVLGLVLTVTAIVLMAAAFLHAWVVPRIDNWRPHIESYLTEKIGHGVRIGRITAQSSGLLPSFELQNVQVLDAQQSPALQLGQVQVSVSPLSLLTFEMDRLTIDAPTVQIARDANGHISIAGFKLNSEGGSGQSLDWLFSQKEIVIRGGTLNWTDAAPHVWGQADAWPAATWRNVALSLKNGLRSHRIQIQATPPAELGQTWQLTGQFSQPLMDTRAGHWQAWTGKVDASIDLIPELAKGLHARLDWPLQTISVEAEQFTLNRLPALAKLAGRALPAEAIMASAPTTQLEQMKLQISRLSSPQLQVRLQTDVTSGNATGKIDATWQKEGNQLNAMASMGRIDLATLQRYLPERVGNQHLLAWQNIVSKGQLRDTRLSWKGTLDELPSELLTKLRVQGKVVDATLNLPQKLDAPPTAQRARSDVALNDVALTFDLQNTYLAVKDIKATLRGMTMRGAALIEDVRAPIIQAQATLGGELADALAIVHTEPLKTLTKDVFASTQASGKFDSTLQLTLPLTTLAKSKVTGHIQLLDNSFAFSPATPPLSHIRGKIDLTDAGFQLSNLQANTLGGSLKLSGNAQKIMGSGTFSAEGLAAWSGMPLRQQLLPYLHGAAPYQFSLEPRLGGQGLVIDSSLVGMQLDLPAPLHKPAASPRPLHIQQVKTNAQQDHLIVSLDQVIAAHFVRAISHEANRPSTVQQGSIMLRQASDSHPPFTVSDLVMPDQGVSASLQLESLNLSAWSPLLNTLDRMHQSSPSADLTNAANPASATSTVVASYMPRQITAQIGTLQFAQRDFAQVVVGASKVGQVWRINANANDFNGYGEYRPPSTDQMGQVYLRLSKLVVPDANSKSQIERLLQAAPERIPSIDLVVDEFEVTGKKIGRIEMLAINQPSPGYLGAGTAQEWRVQNLNITNPDATLKATGVWLPSREITPGDGHADEMVRAGSNKRRVDLQFQLDVADSGMLLERLALPGTLKEGKGSIQGRVAWVGSPWAINIPTLSGQLKLDMSKGQFLKIEPGRAGRFFNVLSLQALPRLLTLDFRDVFSDGFAFDSLSGDAQFNQGVLRLNHLQMKSVLALVSIDGSVDLVKETQNLHVLVLPDINAGGVSLLATIINPIVGVATYLTQLVLRRPIVAAATKEYTIQGSWQEPKITQKQASAPAPTKAPPTQAPATTP